MTETHIFLVAEDCEEVGGGADVNKSSRKLLHIIRNKMKQTSFRARFSGRAAPDEPARSG